MKLARDIMSLSTFKRDSNKVVRQMKKTKQPVVLTVNGKAAVVVQDAESHQNLLELKERAEVVETLRQRLASRKKGRTAETFSPNSSPRMRFQTKTNEEVQGPPSPGSRNRHQLFFPVGLPHVGAQSRRGLDS
jgi:prevent-host-death family protein